MAILKGLTVALILCALALFAGGAWRLHQGSSGAHVVVTVTDCHHVDGLHGGSTECSGSWVVGGSLLGNGHVVLGTIDGVGRSDIGKGVNARASGDTAYTSSKSTPIALFCVGLGLLAIASWFVWSIVKQRKPRAQ